MNPTLILTAVRHTPCPAHVAVRCALGGPLYSKLIGVIPCPRFHNKSYQESCGTEFSTSDWLFETETEMRHPAAGFTQPVY